MKDTQLLKSDVVEMLNYRIQQEEFSSRLYEQMSLWLDDNGFINVSKLYKKYSGEEMNHAGWAKQFLLDYGVTPTLKPLASPEGDYSKILDILEATLSHEVEITRQCEDMASKALKMNSHTLYSLAVKYCGEQVEEIGKAITMIDIYKLTNSDLTFDGYVGEHYMQ
jgi:ferritin